MGWRTLAGLRGARARSRGAVGQRLAFLKTAGAPLTPEIHAAGAGSTQAATRFRETATHIAPGARNSKALHNSLFPEIADLAFLSDSEFCAIVATDGSVVWLSVERPESPSVFGALLDPRAGRFRLGPTGATVPSERRYLPGSLVLETVWQGPTGWLRLREALCIRPRPPGEKRCPSKRRAPSDYEATAVLVRTLECIHGVVEVDLDCHAAFDYGRVNACWSYEGDSYGEAVAWAPESAVGLRLTTDLALALEGPQAVAHTCLQEGETRFVALSWGRRRPPASYEQAVDDLEVTARAWRRWLTGGHFPDHRWTPLLQRSALVLRGLTYEPTGALLAAATTSLPETPGGARQWDYRYCWVRDASFSAVSLSRLGLRRELENFLYFMADVLEDSQLQPVVAVNGEPELHEFVIPHLRGYDGAWPARGGNDAYKQRQNDCWGVLLHAAWVHVEGGGRIPERLWPILCRQVEGALAHWREPDRGFWEVRGEPKHFTSSKLWCWVAADRGARLAGLRGDPELAERWHEAAAEIRTDICARGVNARGVFVQHYDGEALDASLLLVPLVDFLPADHPWVRATVEAIERELTVDGLVLRYRIEETDDGLVGQEATFTVCSFWLVSALTAIGETARARQLCERLLSFASPLGLYAEELDPRTGRQWSNFPQAYSHLGLIDAGLDVIELEDDGGVSEPTW